MGLHDEITQAILASREAKGRRPMNHAPSADPASASDRAPCELNALYSQIQRSLAFIVVQEDGETISKGTGFFWSADGVILTAAHTVAGGFPVREGETANPARTILVRGFGDDKPTLYRSLYCPLVQVVIPGLTEPLQLDVAIIVPSQGVKVPRPFLMPSLEPPQLGEEMFFGGYSEEVQFPFMIDRKLDPKIDGLGEFRREFSTGIRMFKAGPIIKRGTVGSVILGTASSAQAGLCVTQFYLDNQIHDGASGGPIVTRDGLVRGIIVERATALAQQEDASKLKVPSGSTLGVGLDLLSVFPITLT